MKSGRSLFFACFFLAAPLLIAFMKEDSDILNIKKILIALDSYIRSVSGEKLYLQTDKSLYFAGERIWFKAYLVDAVDHKPGVFNNPVYVELINPHLKKVQIIRLRINKGIGTGSFLLIDTVPEGIYQIRAYTNWMKNSAPEYFFHKNLEIRNQVYECLITSKEARSNRKKVRKNDKQNDSYQIGIFPEGGQLLYGVNSKIAFKVTNGMGNGLVVQGEITDNKKNVVAKIETIHDGMGVFVLKPLIDHKYTANINFPDGSERRFPLPSAMENAVALGLRRAKNQLILTINSNKTPSDDHSANDFIIIGHVRGKAYFTASQNILDNNSDIIVEDKVFPSGVVQFTLFNNRLLPVSERLCFINHSDFLEYEILGEIRGDSARIACSPRNLSAIAVKFTGSMAVTIIDTKNQNLDSENILSDLLLTSDLPGKINDPLQYFSNTPEAKEYAELLMLTHGWKRFNWQDVIENNSPAVRFDKETGISVYGKITSEIFKFPVSDAIVNMYILNEYNDEYTTTTDSKGNFFFRDMDYSDTINVRIAAKKTSGSKNILIQLDESPSEKIRNQSDDYYLTTISKINKKSYRQEQSRISREEIKIRQKELDSIYSKSLHGTPDYVIWNDDIPDGSKNALDAIRSRVPGVSVSGDKVVIRGPGKIMGSNDPLLLIDDVPVSYENLYTVPVEDIERIEILKGPSTSIYGSRGGNGVIAIYTKHGSFMKHGEISFSILGYHITERFYAPNKKQLATRIDKQKLPLTVLWSPLINTQSNESFIISVPLVSLPRQRLQAILEGITEEGRIVYGRAIFTYP
jgi:TonB-dependent SusC/RagA subfamily outer membrane receptor